MDKQSLITNVTARRKWLFAIIALFIPSEIVMSRETSLAKTKLQEARAWQGEILKASGNPNPYPDSYNPGSPNIEPTANTPAPEDDIKVDFHPDADFVSKVKFLRSVIQDEKVAMQALKDQYIHAPSPNQNAFGGQSPAGFYDDGFIAINETIKKLTEANHWLGYCLAEVKAADDAAAASTDKQPVSAEPSILLSMIRFAFSQEGAAGTDTPSSTDSGSKTAQSDTRQGEDTNNVGNANGTTVSDASTNTAGTTNATGYANTDSQQNGTAVVQDGSNAVGSDPASTGSVSAGSGDGNSSESASEQAGLGTGASDTEKAQNAATPSPAGATTAASTDSTAGSPGSDSADSAVAEQPVKKPISAEQPQPNDPAEELMQIIATQYPELVDEVAEPLTIDQAREVCTIFPKRAQRQAILNDLLTNHFADMERTGATSIISVFNAITLMGELENNGGDSAPLKATPASSIPDEQA